jgi:hypothetical protein
MIYDASDRKDVRRAQKDAKFFEAQRLTVIGQIMDSVAGRTWMLDLLEKSHIFAPSFTGDALRSAFAEGERYVGLTILNDLMVACPDKYMLMMQERNARDAARTRDDSAAAEYDRGEDPGGGDQGPINDLAYRRGQGDLFGGGEAEFTQ